MHKTNFESGNRSDHWLSIAGGAVALTLLLLAATPLALDFRAAADSSYHAPDSAATGGPPPTESVAEADSNQRRVDPEPLLAPWWFFATLGLLAGAGVLGLHRARVRRLVEVERVRTRIATDLHDDIGSSLTQIAILSEVALSHAQRHDPVLTEMVERIGETSRELVDAMSDVVWAVNPAEDRLSELVQRIRRFGADLSDSQQVEFRFHAPGSDQNVVVDADERRATYLVFKESINNAIKHSGCGKVDCELTVAEGWLVLTVHDDGSGFDPEAGGRGRGLASMKSRARSMRGEFSIASHPESGTTETLRLPLSSLKRLRRKAKRRAHKHTSLSRIFNLAFRVRRPSSRDEQKQGWIERGPAGTADSCGHSRGQA